MIEHHADIEVQLMSRKDRTIIFVFQNSWISFKMLLAYEEKLIETNYYLVLIYIMNNIYTYLFIYLFI